ncbi:substrate-binding domain-containing protein [Bacillus testis]|uniref:substrate-binding domain-containing protein n=1 Tax=Bacillus testis TaxID=1622072 RepID=UPI00067F6057
MTAYEMISLLEASGIQVPDDVSIISFNNHSLSEHSRPALTSVDIHIFQLGYEATGCLIDQIKNPATPVKRIIIPADLIIRDSCTPFCRE